MKESQLLHHLLKQYWGFDSFRPLQEEIIHSVLEGQDTFALLPTGGGKSLCYQIPALAREGICIVISPLIALMKDQVEALQERGVKAEAIHSGLDSKSIDRIFDNCIFGEIKLLYISPERLHTDMAAARIRKMKLTMVAVDEAHCISQWGYDFRPAYMQIPIIREWHPEVPIIALTATATPRVQEDILIRLGLKDPRTFKKSFFRDNLRFAVRHTDNKLQRVTSVLKRIDASAIVYARNRKKTRTLAEVFNQEGLNASAYHAGLTPQERSGIQEGWLKNNPLIIVSTNAFGMGIDKSDVRTVVHYDIPPSLEEYYQEAGRAGRDGALSNCLLVYDESDREQAIRQFEQSYPSLPVLRTTYKALNNYYNLVPGTGKGQTFDFDLMTFCNHFQLDLVEVHHSTRILQEEGWISMSDAVWTPSKVRISVGRDGLYQYQLQDAKSDELLKALLRNYEGLFLDPTRIREGKLAQLLDTEQSDIIRRLEKLSRDGIIEYEPSSDKPRITFINERVEERNFTIDVKSYKWRKKLAGDRLRAVLDYLTTRGCRLSFILTYFGEIGAKPCGKCDRCTKKAGARPSKRLQRLLAAIPESGISLKQFLLEFGADEERNILKDLQFMEQEEYIALKKDMIYLRKSGRVS